jgi:hypothetical protein
MLKFSRIFLQKLLPPLLHLLPQGDDLEDISLNKGLDFRRNVSEEHLSPVPPEADPPSGEDATKLIQELEPELLHLLAKGSFLRDTLRVNDMVTDARGSPHLMKMRHC